MSQSSAAGTGAFLLGFLLGTDFFLLAMGTGTFLAGMAHSSPSVSSSEEESPSALMALTFITVAVSYLHLPPKMAIAVALFVATIKGSLVACYFMHLISEKRLIYAVLVITVVKFVALLALPALTHGNGFWINE